MTGLGGGVAFRGGGGFLCGGGFFGGAALGFAGAGAAGAAFFGSLRVGRAMPYVTASRAGARTSRPLPSCLPAYIATSAFLSNVCASIASTGASA